MITLIVLFVLAAIASVWWRSAGSGPARFPNSLFRPHNLSTHSRPPQVIEVQRKAISTFSGLLVRTLGEKGFVSGSSVRIWVSPEAWQVTLPLRSKVEEEVEFALLDLARNEGWRVPDNLSVVLAMDEDLTGLDMRGESMLDETTSRPSDQFSTTDNAWDRYVHDHGNLDDPDATQLTPPKLTNLTDSSEHVVFPAQPLIVGRSGTVSNWVIANEYLSNAHAVFETTRGSDGGWNMSIYDRGSTNGTKVGTTQLAPNARRALRDGDVVTLGPGVRLQVDLIG